MIMNNNNIATTDNHRVNVNLVRLSNISQCMFDFANIKVRNTINGVVIINMNDVFSLNKTADDRSEFMRALLAMIPDELSVVCYLDAREIYHNFRQSLAKTSIPEENILIEFGKTYSILFSDLYTGSGCTDNQLNTLISYRYDSMHIIGLDFKGFIKSCIHSTIRYIAKTFDINWWILGQTEPINYSRIADNTNFLAMVTHDFRFLPLDEVMTTGKSCFTLSAKHLQPGSAELERPYFREYVITKTVMTTNKNECVKRLNSQYQKIQTQYERIIETTDPNVHQIVFLNLDPVFDSNLIEPLETLWSTHPYIRRNSISSSTAEKRKASDCCTQMPDNNQIGTFFNMLGMSSSFQQDPGQIPVPDIMITPIDSAGLTNMFGGGKHTARHNQSSNTSKNNIHYTRLPMLSFNPGRTFHPNKLRALTNMNFSPTWKHKGQGSINVIIGQNITRDHFQQIIHYIIDNPKYPNNIVAKYVDFQINPMIRINLGLMKYSTLYYDLNILGKQQDHMACHKLYTDYIKWAEWVKQSANINESTGPDATTVDACCNCCKCNSKKAMAKYVVGNLPYVSQIVQKLICETPTFWIPRY